MTRVCVVGASGKLGRYLVRHALGRGYQVTGVCQAQSVAKLDAFLERITIVPGPTNDREVITDFALFMVAALENESLVHEAPAIVGCRTPPALAYGPAAAGAGHSPGSAAPMAGAQPRS